VLQRARTDMKKPIEKIEVYRADHARVKSGNPQRRGSSRRPASQVRFASWRSHTPAVMLFNASHGSSPSR
jgi:hypothetical protein